MGAVKKVVGSIFGSAKAPKVPTYKPPAAAPAVDAAPVETQAEKDAKARVALNAGLTEEQQVALAQKATVTKKALLGL